MAWPRSNARSSSRSAALTAATAGTAVPSSCASTRQATTLLDYHRHPHRRAENGKPGAGDERNGADGGDLILPVPEGTVVKDGGGRIIVDLVGMGTEHVIARGGRGGLGNKALASARRKAPGFALLGEPGEDVDVVLELKTLADVALIGFPQRGQVVAGLGPLAARPKIADYPFTTLVPNLGVVTAGSSRFTVADVPGLIPGAHEGKGLGLEFLRHVERCSVLVHVIDCATLEPGRDPLTDLEVIERELSLYVPDADLGGRPLSSARVSSCSTRPTSPRPASWPSWSSRTSRSAATRSSSSRPSLTWGSRSWPTRWPDTWTPHAPRWQRTSPSASCSGPSRSTTGASP